MNQVSDPQQWLGLYGDYLYRFALLRTREATVAEELVQETFLAALQAKDRFAGRSAERSWLTGILKHKIVDHFRKGSREIPTDDMERVVAGDDADGTFDRDGHWKLDQTAPLDWPDHPGGVLERKQFWDALARCLGKLPPRMAQVFTLREVDDVSTEELCGRLGITSSNLWVLLHRARKQLRQCLEANYFGVRGA